MQNICKNFAWGYILNDLIHIFYSYVTSIDAWSETNIQYTPLSGFNYSELELYNSVTGTNQSQYLCVVSDTVLNCESHNTSNYETRQIWGIW